MFNIFGYDVDPILLLASALLVGLTILMVSNMSFSNDKLPLFFSYIMVAVLAGTVVAYYEITFHTMALAMILMVGGWFYLMYRRVKNWYMKREDTKYTRSIRRASKKGGVSHG